MPAYNDPTRLVHGGTRTKPAPFQRPSIDLDRVTRRWVRVPIGAIGEGDIIAEFGRVDHVKVVSLVDPVDVQVTVTNDMTGEAKRLRAREIVFAFTNAEVDE